MTSEVLSGRPCTVCGAPIKTKVAPWSARCPQCSTWHSELKPEIESTSLHGSIDVDARSTGLKELRDANNAQILDELMAQRDLGGAKLIDVGSAHGWFLAAAARRGLDAEGIEPERAMADLARAAGNTVRDGYFPDVLDDGEQTDVISFNDVLEHIPDVSATLDACAATLRPGGLLSVNIPSATGLAYRVATTLARVGVRGPYLRLWQHGLPSPHMHYFPPAALAELIEKHGFTVRRVTALQSIRRDGLWSRLHTVRRASPVSMLTFAALWLVSPILNRPGNSDIVLIVAERDA